MPDRLRRLDFTFQRQPIYFITACTRDRRAILNNKAVHRQFVEFANAGEKCGAWIGAYVIMPDHLHAFVDVDDERLMLARWMKSLKNTLSKTLGHNHVAAPHWQKGYFDHVLRSEESYAEKWHYARENPVRAGLVKDWRDWPYLGEIFDPEYRDDLA